MDFFRYYGIERDVEVRTKILNFIKIFIGLVSIGDWNLGKEYVYDNINYNHKIEEKKRICNENKNKRNLNQSKRNTSGMSNEDKKELCREYVSVSTGKKLYVPYSLVQQLNIGKLIKNKITGEKLILMNTDNILRKNHKYIHKFKIVSSVDRKKCFVLFNVGSVWSELSIYAYSYLLSMNENNTVNEKKINGLTTIKIINSFKEYFDNIFKLLLEKYTDYENIILCGHSEGCVYAQALYLYLFKKYYLENRYNNFFDKFYVIGSGSFAWFWNKHFFNYQHFSFLPKYLEYSNNKVFLFTDYSDIEGMNNKIYVDSYLFLNSNYFIIPNKIYFITKKKDLELNNKKITNRIMNILYKNTLNEIKNEVYPKNSSGKKILNFFVFLRLPDELLLHVFKPYYTESFNNFLESMSVNLLNNLNNNFNNNNNNNYSPRNAITINNINFENELMPLRK